MADELNEFEEFNDLDTDVESSQQQSDDDANIIGSLLRDQGIEDPLKIKIANDNGDVEETSWDTLSTQEKLGILNTPKMPSDADLLDNDELLLINTIRTANMTPKEYLAHVQQVGIENFAKQGQQAPPPPNFIVDDYSDDELFAADFASRMENATEDEIVEALDKAKSNPTLYKKQIDALRKEYSEIEQENTRIALALYQEQAQQQYNLFAYAVANEINGLTEYEGYDLNLEPTDKQQLYEFITGFDAAGLNHFAKALADPKILVQAAWFALNGRQMIKDITDYFTKEITNVRKLSYEKGRTDRGRIDNRGTVVFANKNKSLKANDDIDFV